MSAMHRCSPSRRAILALAGLSPRDVRRFLATLHGRGLSGRSLARVLSSWRTFFRFLQDRDAGIKDNPCTGLKPPRSARRLPAVLSPDEAVRLVAIDGTDTLSLRDRALFELAYSSGLRLAELAGLDLDRIDLDHGEVRVWGKGAKERIVPVGAAARDAIRAWLARAQGASAARREGALSRPQRRAHLAARHPAPPRRMGGEAGASPARAPAHAPAFVRVARAAIVGRSPRGAGDARAREHRLHAGLHPPRFPVSRAGVRPRASPREAQAPVAGAGSPLCSRQAAWRSTARRLTPRRGGWGACVLCERHAAYVCNCHMRGSPTAMSRERTGVVGLTSFPARAGAPS